MVTDHYLPSWCWQQWQELLEWAQMGQWMHKTKQRQAGVGAALHQSIPLAIQHKSSMLSCIVDEALHVRICISTATHKKLKKHIHTYT